MNYQEIESLIFIVMYTLLSIFILMTMIFLLVSLVQSKKAKKAYKLALVKLLIDKKKNHNLDIKNSIEFLFNNYQTKSNFSYLSFSEINSELIADLRSSDSKLNEQIEHKIDEKDIQKLEVILKEIQEQYTFSDEKAKIILEKIQNSNITKDEKIYLDELFKNYFTSTLSFCDGRIFEKEQKIVQLTNEIEKLKKKKIVITLISGVFSIIGFISSVMTIIGYVNGS
mgnify:CR=1 FL=1